MSAPVLIQIITEYYVEWFLQRWMICATLNDLYYTLNDLYYVERFAIRRMICTTLKDLYNVELFLLRWKLCTTLNDLYCVERFVLCWMIRSAVDDLYNVESHLDYDGLLSIGFLMSARCAYSRKYCKIFYINLWVAFFLI